MVSENKGILMLFYYLVGMEKQHHIVGRQGLSCVVLGVLCPGFYWLIRTLFKRNARALLVLGQVMHDMFL